MLTLIIFSDRILLVGIRELGTLGMLQKGVS